MKVRVSLIHKSHVYNDVGTVFSDDTCLPRQRQTRWLTLDFRYLKLKPQQIANPERSDELRFSMSANGYSNGVSHDLQYVSLTYNNAESQTSALRLILKIFPDWEHADGNVEFIRFTDGITNTVCRAHTGLERCGRC